ncbi:somatostatin receptor type 5 [Betta splendens]|uniref:Somatostatin receptor type 5 n=1 Tax=Betta splendens TaxID=158456 RepID=A0A6P7LBJ7_BETSP|nr:somatostatin receptor type 5 [Betta splendens]
MAAFVLSDVDYNHSYLDEHFYFESPSEGYGVAMVILYLLVCVVGLAGNALVIVAILKLDRMSSSTTVYIFNLALADGLFMAGLPFIASQNLQNYWMFGDAACKAVMVLDGINQFTSAFCLTAMSADRYAALADPPRFAGWRTPRRAKLVSALLWLLSLLTILPMALHFSAERGQCVPTFASDAWWLGVLTYTFAAGFAAPFAVMTAAYAALLLALRRQRRRAPAPARGAQRLERQVTRMVVAVVAVFGACWLPFYTFNFWSLHQDGLFLTFARAFEVVVLLSYSWSCANPILYACLSDTFRRHFRTLLCCAEKSAPSMLCDTEQYDLNEGGMLDVTVLA